MEAEQIVRELASLSAHSIAILCGAGISYDSGLPIVSSFYDKLLPFFFETKDAEQIRAIVDQKNVPFERIIEHVLSFTDADLSLLDVYSHGAPNTIHTIIAKILQGNCAHEVYTTNFDLLLEKAFDQVGIHIGKQYERRYKEEQFSCAISQKRMQLFKIHGTIDAADSIRATLETITSQSLLEPRKEVIERIFLTGKHGVVLAAGYSFSDNFDINVLIREMNITKRIVIIEHLRDTTSPGEVIPISSWDNPNNPFQDKDVDGVVVKINTQRFFEELIEMKYGKCASSDPVEFDWSNIFTRWATRHERTKLYPAGGICNALFDYQLGEKYLKLALQNSDESDIKLVIPILDQLVLSEYRTASDNKNNQELVTICTRSLLSLQENQGSIEPVFFNKYMSAFNFRLGRIYEDEFCDFQKALHYYYRSYRYEWRMHEERGMAETLHQLGSVYGHLDMPKMSIKCLLKSIELKRNCGYIGGVARSYYTIAATYAGNNRDYAQAAFYLDEAEKLIPAGELDLIFYIRNLRGNILYNNGKLTAAKKILSKNKTELQDTMPFPVYATAIYELGRVQLMLGAFSDAIHNLNAALSIAQNKDIHDRQLRSMQHLALANLLSCSLDKSVSIFAKCLHLITEDIPDSDRATFLLFSSILFRQCNSLKTYRVLKLAAHKEFVKANENILYSQLIKYLERICSDKAPKFQPTSTLRNFQSLLFNSTEFALPSLRTMIS